MIADLLLWECMATVAIIGLHEAAAAMLGRPIPTKAYGTVGVDYRDVALRAGLVGERLPVWRGVERRAAVRAENGFAMRRR